MNLFKVLFGTKADNPEEERKAAEEKNFDALKYDGVKAIRMGQFALAVDFLTRALEITDDLETRDYLSQALIRQGRLVEAAEQLRLLSEAEPENVGIYLRRADVAFMMEDYKAVGDACEKALLYDSDNAMALYFYGRACMGMGDDVNAVAMFSKALEKDDNLGDAMLMRSKAYLSMGDTESAAADINHLREKNPENEDVLLTAASVAEQCGNNSEALEILGQVMELNPFCGEALLRRSTLRQQMGDEAGAAEDLQAYKEIKPEADDENIARRVEESRRAIDPFGIG